MILGTGIDLVDIRRIEKSLARFGARFEERTFTIDEQAYACSTANPAATYAKRFAAKEACLKALRTGHKDGVYLRDVEVVKTPGGAPALVLHGNAKKCLAALTPAGMQAHLFLSLTDEYPYAQAQVIIEAVHL